MFDPTIFENLKVALENQLYDLDNIDEAIRIIGRDDRLEMSVMSREFAIRFELAGRPKVFAEMRLEASLADLSAEILEIEDARPGCRLKIGFGMSVTEAETECGEIERILKTIWPDIPLVQTLTRVYGAAGGGYENKAELRFQRKIDEEQMGDLPELIQYVLQSLAELCGRAS